RDGWRLHACRRDADTPDCSGEPTPRRAFRVERASVDGHALLLLAEGSDHGRVSAVAEDDLRPMPIAALSVGEPWRVVGDEVWAIQPGEAGALLLVAHSLREGGTRQLATRSGLRLLLGEGCEVSAHQGRLVPPVATGNDVDIGVSHLRPG